MTDLRTEVRGKLVAVRIPRMGSSWGFGTLTSNDHSQQVKLVGNLGGASVGSSIVAHGKWEKHTSYGDQFVVDELVGDLPEDDYGIRTWLVRVGKMSSSEARVLAKSYPGTQLWKVLIETPAQLTVIHGISPTVVGDLADLAYRAKNERDVYVRGIALGLKAKEAGLLFRKLFKPHIEALPARTEATELIDRLWSTVTADPWDLYFKYSFGFRRVLSISDEWKFDVRSPKRTAAAIVEGLRVSARDGDTAAPRKDVISEADILLNTESSRVVGAAEWERAIQYAVDAHAIVVNDIDDYFLALRRLDEAERNIATTIDALVRAGKLRDDARDSEDTQPVSRSEGSS